MNKQTFSIFPFGGWGGTINATPTQEKNKQTDAKTVV